VTRALNVVLGLIVVVLVAWLVVFAVHGSVAAPGRTPAEQQAHELTEIRQAAQAEAIAFLTVDYRRMDQIIDRILEGATGKFKKEFESTLKVLKPGVVAQEVVAKGSVRELGVGTFDGDSATVFVSGISRARSKETEGKFRTMPTRLRLDMTKVGKRWLVSNLEYVS
jgi:Mce-associated membrane protein